MSHPATDTHLAMFVHQVRVLFVLSIPERKTRDYVQGLLAATFRALGPVFVCAANVKDVGSGRRGSVETFDRDIGSEEPAVCLRGFLVGQEASKEDQRMDVFHFRENPKNRLILVPACATRQTENFLLVEGDYLIPYHLLVDADLSLVLDIPAAVSCSMVRSSISSFCAGAGNSLPLIRRCGMKRSGRCA